MAASSSARPTPVSRATAFMRPLDWMQTATTAVSSASAAVNRALPHVPKGADGPLDWVQQVSKSDLRPGDHVYCWKLGYTYNHHGIVVHTQDCPPDCPHDSLHCCSIVHFRVPGESPGCIELVPLADFKRGRGLCLCRYGVPNAEFYLRRAGSCSTHKADPWPLTVIRALSLLDVSGAIVDTEEAAAAAQIEYDMLKKNCELLSRWCKIGGASGVQRFRSQETAFSLQSSPGRFVRLGLAVGVPIAIAGGVAIAAGGVTAAATSAGVAGSATAGASGAANIGAASAASGAAGSMSAAAAAGTAGAATAAGTAAAAHSTAAGTTAAAGTAGIAAARLSVAGSAAAAIGREACIELLKDMAKRPEQAKSVIRDMWETVPAINRAPTAAPHRSLEAERRYNAEQQEGLVTSLQRCLEHLNIHIPKTQTPLLHDPLASSRLCEIIVDVLEDAEPQEERGCSALIHRFLEDLNE